MRQNYTVLGLAGAAFLVTLGITSWQNGLWRSDEPGAQPGGVAVSHAIDKPNPIPKDPFHGAVMPPAAPLPAQPQTTQLPPPQPQPPLENIPSGNAPSDTQAMQSAAPDPIYEQSQDDYKQRAKLMEEIAARARAQ